MKGGSTAARDMPYVSAGHWRLGIGDGVTRCWRVGGLLGSLPTLGIKVVTRGLAYKPHRVPLVSRPGEGWRQAKVTWRDGAIGGLFLGRSPCRTLILLNGNVTCLCRLFTPMSFVEFKKLPCRMSLSLLIPCPMSLDLM